MSLKSDSLNQSYYLIGEEHTASLRIHYYGTGFLMLCHYAEVLYKLKEYDLAKVYWMQAIKQNNGEVLRLEENVQKKLEAVGKW